MAVVLGTNSGFVSVAPTVDPAGTDTVADSRQHTSNDTSPSTATKVVEMGWWCNDATEESNFEVGLYAADGTDGKAGTLLFSSVTNAKGTGSGWKSATVDWSISPSTSYWLAFQLDNTATTTNTNFSATGGTGRLSNNPRTTLLSPYSGEIAYNSVGMVCVYAVWEAASGPANLKTYNTNPVANVKTINTNPIANVKSLNTNV